MSEPTPPSAADFDTVTTLLNSLPESQQQAIGYCFRAVLGREHAQEMRDQVALQSVMLSKVVMPEISDGLVSFQCALCPPDDPMVYAERARPDPVSMSDIYSAFIQHVALAGHQLPSLDEVDAETDGDDGMYFMAFVGNRTKAPDDLSSLPSEEN